MKIQERSFSGKLFRPRPEIHIDSAGGLIIVATPWGPRSSARKAIQVIQDHLSSAGADDEATSPFAKLTCISVLANHLRTGVKLANDIIYNEDNKNEYMSGLELFAMIKSGSEVCWIQVGMPVPLLDRPQRPMTTLGNAQDLAIEYTVGPQLLSPLPSKLLGSDITSDFATESLHPTLHDRVILVSRSGLVPSILSLSAVDRTVDNISAAFAKDDTDLPFWIGIIEF